VLQAFVNSADGNELLALCYGCFVHVEKCLIRIGLEAVWVLVIVANMNGSFLCREQSPGTRSLSVLYQLCSAWAAVVKNQVLQWIFEHTREEVMRYCRKLHNLKLHNLHSLPSIVRNSKRIWVGCVACVSDYWGKIQIYVGFRLRNLKGRGLLKDVSADGGIMSL
jgi:hypothetical protein